MFGKDSEIRDIPDSDSNDFFSEVELIYATSHSLLYRMRKDGKYFIVKQSAIPEEKGRKILRREYELSIGIDHPNIVDVYEYKRGEDGKDKIIMEYVEGRNLNDFLAERPSLKSRKRIFSELLDAIEYLHKKGVVHNDLKPENILISRNGNRLKLIDLGLANDDAHFAVKSPGFTKGFSEYRRKARN